MRSADYSYRSVFPRELSEIIKVKYSKIKVSFDVICLMITACMTGLILGHINGLGIGTVWRHLPWEK